MDCAGWDERYRGSELVWGAGPNRFLVQETQDLSPGSALDVACGEGRNAIWLSEQGWQATGVDFSEVAIDKARRLTDERGVHVEWVVADLLVWDPPGTFDLVVVMYLHIPAGPRRGLLERLARSVAPGGTLLVVGHDSSNIVAGYGGPQDPALLYTPDEVVADLNGLLLVDQARKVSREVSTPEGEKEAIDAMVKARRPEAR